jgi:hypothetical protein
VSDNVMKSFSGFGTSLLASLCILFLSTTAQAKTDCSEIEKSIKSDPFEIAESLLDDGLPKICAYFLAEHLNKKGYAKNQNKIQKLLTLAARYSDRIKEPELTAKILVLKLDTEYDQSSFSKDRKSLRRLNKAKYEELRKAKKNQLMRPIILAAINPLKDGKSCAIPEKKSPWLKFLIGDSKKILAQCSKASNVRHVTAQIRKRKLPNAAQLKMAKTNLTSVGRFSAELEKKYASMSGVNKAHKIHLNAAAKARKSLEAGAKYIATVAQAHKEKAPAKKRVLLKKAAKHAKVLGFDSKGVGKGISNLKSYADAKQALKKVPAKLINRSKLATWLKDKNVKRDPVVHKSLKLILQYQDCLIAEFLEKASGCQKFKVFPDKNTLSNTLNVQSLTDNVKAKIKTLLHSGWDGVTLYPDYKGNTKAFFTALVGPYAGIAKKLIATSEFIDTSEFIAARNIANGHIAKAAGFIQGLRVDIQSQRGWITYGKCLELNGKLKPGPVKGLSSKLINSRFSKMLDVFSDHDLVISYETKLQYLSQCSEVTTKLLTPWLDQHFASLCKETVFGYERFALTRIGRNMSTISEQLKFGILLAADYGNQKAVVLRNYFQRKVFFLQYLERNDFVVAKGFLDTEVNIGCLGSINDTTAFYKYQEMQSRLPSKSIAQSNQNFVVSDPAGNRIYGSHQQKILDYVEPEFVGDTSFMWDQASADSRSVAFSAIMSSTTGKFDSAETQLNVLRSRLPKSVPKISSYIASARSDRNLWNLYSGPAISVEGVNGMIRYDSIRGVEEKGWQIAYKKGSYDNIVEAPGYWSRVPLDLHTQVRRESLMAFFASQYFKKSIKQDANPSNLGPTFLSITTAIDATKGKHLEELADVGIADIPWSGTETFITSDTNIISEQIRRWRLAELSFVKQWTILTRLMGDGCSIDYLTSYLIQKANWRKETEPQRPVKQLDEMTPAMKFTLDDLYRQAYGYVENGSCAETLDNTETQLAPAGNEGGGN